MSPTEFRTRLSALNAQSGVGDGAFAVAALGSFPHLSTNELPGDGGQIVGDDAPAHVPFEPRLPFVHRSDHREGMLERADAAFDAGSPALCPAEPALLLAGCSGERQSTRSGDGDFLHA